MSDETTTDSLPALYAELERIGAEASEWAEVEASDSTALVHVGSADPEKVREQMIEVRREARQKSKDLQAAADKVRGEIEAELSRQRGEMQARMKAAMAALAPLQEQVKRMEEGIWTVNLYLGTSEEITTLRTGKAAPVDTPIHLRTSVLAMDEEVAAFPSERGKTDWQGMDYRDLDMFDRWLVEEPEHLAQVLPEERGMVVFTPRRTEKVYHEDPLINDAMNEGNFESYWLIRNGENLYRLRTNFKVGANLMPTTAEFTALFQREVRNHETGQYETVEITPGTREWEDAEKAQDGKRRHYMRVALIVQGLIDRTEVFHPLHAAVNVMQQRTYDDGLVVVINDTENTLITSREPYFDWIRRLNAELRPGMRIIGTFRGGEWDQHEFKAERWSSAEGNTRIHPHNAERPPANELLLIEGRKDFDRQKGLVVKYKRTEKVWTDKWVESEDRPGWGTNGGYYLPKTRASAVILPTDTSIIPFDVVTEAEMQEYLDARTERHAYAKMFPLLQAAIDAKRAEREAEAPFRDLLTRVLANDNDQTLDEVAPHIDDLVHRFKLGNKWHRPLVSLTQDDEAKALRLIRAEYKRIVNSGATEERDAKVLASLRAYEPDLMFVGRLSSGKYVGFAPQPRQYGEGVVAQNLWVREVNATKTGLVNRVRDWVIPGVRGSKMTEVFADDRWVDWDMLGTSTDDVTDDEMATLIEFAKDQCMPVLRQSGGRQVEFLAVGHDRDKRQVVVMAHDGMAAPTRALMSKDKHKVQHLAHSVRWERKGSEVTAKRVDLRAMVNDYEFGGKSDHWNRTPDDDRPMKAPWESLGYYEPKPLPIEVDEEVLAEAERTFRATVKVNRTIDTLNGKVYPALRWINEQQVEEQTAAIKAKFLDDYPDEDMWEERRQTLCKGVRVKVDVSDRHHFMTRVKATENSYSLHERTDGALSMGDALRALMDAGTIEWDGLTVGDMYDLIGEPIPDTYVALRNLRLTRPAEAPDDEDE